MPKEKQKKHDSLTKRILRWIWTGLLTILLVAGLLLQAPWKVITLLLIFLLAATALPKQYRKHFWLTVLVIVIALAIWVFLPENNKDWQPYTFDKELAALEAKRAIPEDENAAVIYDQLIISEQKHEEAPPNEKMAELMEKGEATIPLEDVNDWLASSYSTFYPDFWTDELDDLTKKNHWRSKDYPKIAEWLKTHETTIAGLLEAAHKEKCRFPIPPDIDSLSESLTRLSSMRRWCYLLVRAANNDIGDNRIDDGIQKITIILRMAQHLYQQPSFINLLVAISFERLAIEQLNKSIITANLENQHFVLIEQLLGTIKHNWNANFPNILDCDKLMAKNMMGMIYEVSPQNKMRFNRNPMATIRTLQSEDTHPLTYWKRKYYKTAAITAWFTMPSSPQKTGEFIDSIYDNLYTMADPNYNWPKDLTKEHFYMKNFNWTKLKLNFKYLVTATMSTSKDTIHTIHNMYFRSDSMRKACQLLIAIRQYKNQNGSWPKSLDDIKGLAKEDSFIDSTNDNPFVYKRTDDSFILYSKGGDNSYDYPSKVINDCVYRDDHVVWPKDKKRIDVQRELGLPVDDI